VLSALTHGRGDVEQAVAIAQAALEASASLDDLRAPLYADLVFLGLGEAARALMEAMMIPEKYEYQSDFARKYYGQGKAEGRAEGEAMGRAEGEAKGRIDALLVVLAARGLTPSPEQLARIIAERDGTRIDLWIGRAVRAADFTELLRDDDAG